MRERQALVEYAADALPLSTQADLLSISRRSLYYQPKPPPPEEVAIKHRIDELYTAHPFYGSRKLTVLLEPTFGPINRKRVQRYMREMGIAGIAPGPNLSKRLTEHRVYPYLLRDITAQHPNHIWGCDITYIRLRHGWLYLVAIIDWFSRYVISWMLDETPGDWVCARGDRASAGAGHPADLEHRSGQSFHQSAGHPAARSGGRSDQYGWQGAGIG